MKMDMDLVRQVEALSRRIDLARKNVRVAPAVRDAMVAALEGELALITGLAPSPIETAAAAAQEGAVQAPQEGRKASR